MALNGQWGVLCAHSLCTQKPKVWLDTMMDQWTCVDNERCCVIIATHTNKNTEATGMVLFQVHLKAADLPESNSYSWELSPALCYLCTLGPAFLATHYGPMWTKGDISHLPANHTHRHWFGSQKQMYPGKSHNLVGLTCTSPPPGSHWAEGINGPQRGWTGCQHLSCTHSIFRCRRYWKSWGQSLQSLHVWGQDQGPGWIFLASFPSLVEFHELFSPFVSLLLCSDGCLSICWFIYYLVLLLLLFPLKRDQTLCC